MTETIDLTMVKPTYSPPLSDFTKSLIPAELMGRACLLRSTKYLLLVLYIHTVLSYRQVELDRTVK